MRSHAVVLWLSLSIVPAAALAMTPDPAHAITLHYTGAPFDRFRTFGAPPAVFDGEDFLSLTVDIAAPLGAGFKGSVVPLAFSFDAGPVHLTNADATWFEFIFETDGTGAIVVWSAEARQDTAARLVVQVTTLQLRPYEDDAGSFASITQCDPLAPAFVCNRIHQAQGFSNAVGRWSTAPDDAATVAAPPALPLLLVGTVALARARGRRGQPISRRR